MGAVAKYQFGEGKLVPARLFLGRVIRIERRRRRRKLRLMERVERRGRRWLRHLDQDLEARSRAL